jgi:hypothetical protein
MQFSYPLLFVMIGQTVDAGDHFKKRAAIPLAPCTRAVLAERYVLSPGALHICQHIAY